MTTQWNPAGQQGEPGADDHGAEEGHGEAGHAAPAQPQARPGDTEQADPDPGPWRVYTMPVPENLEHGPGEAGAGEEHGYDGITGYPAPTSPGLPPTVEERPAQRSTGRHARPSNRTRRAGANEDDPEGLAGWVGSLTQAADDTRIAGRASAGFPSVPLPGYEGPDAEPAAETDTGVPGLTEAEGDEVQYGPDGTAPLPRRVPGASPVSGSFRALGDEAEGTAERSAETSGATAATGYAGAEGDTGHPEDGEDEGEYRPTGHDTWSPRSGATRSDLVERLEALSTLRELGEGELPEQVVERSGQLLDHAGARLRLSGEHTVVALAGGTGSGKSSLFNALCGLSLSQTGITRPTTSKAHACVWGHEGADELLSWLGVPARYRHSRTGVLDSDNPELNGLVLLDLPDHDSVRSMHTAEADRLIGSVDLLVWVLDPQKYADAAVHHRYLAKMAGHGAVTVAVLNQVDRVGAEELEELLTDLRRLLESESGVHPRIITTSTVTDQGVDDLRDFLVEVTQERRALVDRLSADLDVVSGDFEQFQDGGQIPETVPSEVRTTLQKGLSNAVGVSAVADVTEANDVRRGRRRVGWPMRELTKLRKDPLAAVQLDFVRRDTENGVSGRVDAHEAELEKSLVQAADAVSEGMPAMWRRSMRSAARSRVAELPTELGKAVDGAVRGSERTPAWWGFARVVQYLLLGVAGLGTAWMLAAAASRLGGGVTGLRVFDDPVFIAYSGAVVAASLLVGWLTGVGCGNLVEVAAVQRREEIERTAEASVREAADEYVVRPLEAELARFRAFREAYETARGPAEAERG